MQKCINGHSTESMTKCDVCGGGIDYKGSLEGAAALPVVEVEWKRVAILFVGVGTEGVNSRDAFTLALLTGEAGLKDESTLVLSRIEGKTWHDALETYSREYAEWLRSTGFFRAKHKFVVVDCSDPLSVMALQGLDPRDGLLVFAIAADRSLSPLNQNTSFAALRVVELKGLQTIVVSKQYAEDLAFFIEDEGVVFGRSALPVLLDFLVSNGIDLIDLVNKDQEIGIRFHCLSAVFSASDRVYRRCEDALIVGQTSPSWEFAREDAKTVYLIARSEKELEDEIIQSFRRQFSYRSGGFLNTEAKTSAKRSKYGLYDLLILYGLRVLELEGLRKGYEEIAAVNPKLSVERLA